MAHSFPKHAAILAAAVFFAAATARAQPAAEPAGDATAKEVARLRQEMREQRQLLEQIQQLERRRYDLLLKLVQSAAQLGQEAGALPGAFPPPSREPTRSAPPSGASPGTRAGRTATLSGVVTIKGRANGPVFVYVENVAASPARGRSLRIKQEGKQFHPQVAAVQRGAQVTFPNVDRFMHNVFSLSRQQPFDLGMTPAGETGRPVRLDTPGVYDIHCNIHAGMWAQLLVVPNGLFTRVDSDGKFRLAHVPLGERTIVAWTAHSAPVRQKVTVTGQGGDAQLVLEATRAAAHNNKFGQPYGSYQD